ncbi:MAG: hypothetical protein GVY22_05525 [Gammaproteobacteria bacterium]|jgi:hypothetical protein|nr:hypothetical protein [Gammaproteobacteria bacterium]
MTMLDTYCERAGAAGLLAEPINLITNAAFVIAAVFAAPRLAAAPQFGLRNSWDLGLLNLLLGAIGIGSALWHSFATGWAVLADVIPITLFINLYLISFGWRVLRLRPLALAGLWLSYQMLSIWQHGFPRSVSTSKATPPQRSCHSSSCADRLPKHSVLGQPMIKASSVPPLRAAVAGLC